MTEITTSGAKKLKTMVCRKLRCGHTVGTTDGTRIYLNGVLVPGEPNRIAFPCQKCGEMVHWRRRIKE